MRPLLLWASLAVNAAGLALLVQRIGDAPATERRPAALAVPDGPSSNRSPGAVAPVPPPGAVPASTGWWAVLDSSDPRTLLARLKAAGFEPAIAQAILSAKIDILYAPRYQEVEARAGTDAAARRQGYARIAVERGALWRELMQDEFLEPARRATATERRHYGNLPKTKIELLQQITRDYDEMESQLREAVRDIYLPGDREKFDLLQREKKADFAAALTADELADFEFRNSSLADTFALMEATEGEYRIIHGLHRQFADRMTFRPGNPGNMDEYQRQQQAQEEARMEMLDAIRAALPAERFDEYVMAQNHGFQTVARLAQQANLPRTAAVQAFGLQGRFAEESARIVNDTSLPVPERQSRLKALGQEARRQLLGILGPDGGNHYAASSAWIPHLEGGGSLLVRPGGNVGLLHGGMPPMQTPKK